MINAFLIAIVHLAMIYTLLIFDVAIYFPIVGYK